MKKFNSKSCEEIMTTVYKPIEFVVDGLFAQGLYILAGAPKVGKSWLALDMCLSIAKGEKVLGQKTTQGTELYLCLEDSYVRIQNRLYEITDELTEQLNFIIMSETSGNSQRVIILKYDLKSDTSDGKNLMPEAVNFTDPAVTERSSKCVEKPLNTLFKRDDENQKDKNSTDSVSKATVPVCDFTDPVDEKVCEVRWTTLDEILNTSARKIRSKLASQGIDVLPFKS